MAFLIAFTHCVINSDGASNSTIWGYAPNTNSVKTNPLGPVMSLMALNAICSAMSLLISGILTVIIWYAHYSSLWYCSIMLMELWALTGTPFMLIPIVLAYCLNSLLIKFLPILCVTRSGGPRYILIQHIHNTSYVCLALIFCNYLPVWKCVPSSTICNNGLLLMYIMSTMIQ